MKHLIHRIKAFCLGMSENWGNTQIQMGVSYEDSQLSEAYDQGVNLALGIARMKEAWRCRNQ